MVFYNIYFRVNRYINQLTFIISMTKPKISFNTIKKNQTLSEFTPKKEHPKN